MLKYFSTSNMESSRHFQAQKMPPPVSKSILIIHLILSNTSCALTGMISLCSNNLGHQHKTHLKAILSAVSEAEKTVLDAYLEFSSAPKELI